MVSRALLVLAFRVCNCLAEVQVEVLWEFLPVPSPLASLHLDLKPQVVQIFQSPFPHQNSISSLEPRPVHVDSTSVQEVFCELICTYKQTMFRPHQVFIRRCISSPPATADPSVRQLGCSHFMVRDRRECRFTKHAQKVTHTEFRANIGMAFCRRVAL